MKMLMHVTLPPLGPFSADSHIAPLVFMLEGMIDVNRHHLRQARDRAIAGMGVAVPPLYALAGMRCGEDGRDTLGDLFQCMIHGAGDRESLSVWRCAELREAGINAHPVIARVGDSIVCSVRLPDGSIEDASERLGSPSGGRAYDGNQIARTLAATLPPLGSFSPESHFAPLVFMLEGMIKVNRHHIRQARDRARAGMGPEVPSLYHSGVRYKEDPPGEENWGDLYYCLKSGVADCDRLPIWRGAELQEQGIAARPVIKWQSLDRGQAIKAGYPAEFIPPDGLWLVHCCVQFPDGTVEDVSKNLGMGAEYNSRV